MTNIKTILVVDDEPDILDILGEYLRDTFKDCVVVTCPNADRAIEISEDVKFDLILMDFCLGAASPINGFQLQTRLFNTGQDCDVFFITGNMTKEVGERLSRRNKLFLKPFSFDELGAAARVSLKLVA